MVEQPGGVRGMESSADTVWWRPRLGGAGCGHPVPGRDPAVIRAFFVHPDWGRHGFGRRILEACESAAQAAGFHHFELTATPMGVPMYAACGYREVEEVVITLPDGTVLINTLMAKP